MIKEALEWIQQQRNAPPYRESINGLEYTDRKLIEIAPPYPGAIVLETLESFVEFVKTTEKIEGFDCETAYVVVENFMQVKLYRKPDVYGKRHVVAVAEFDPAVVSQFLDRPLGVDSFITEVKRYCYPSEEADQLLLAVSSISLENIATIKDNGVFQEVAVKSGVKVEMWRSTPYLELTLRRTFPEVSDVKSQFFIRIKAAGEKQVAITLHEATFDAWRVEVMKKIRHDLAWRLTGYTVL